MLFGVAERLRNLFGDPLFSENLYLGDLNYADSGSVLVRLTAFFVVKTCSLFFAATVVGF